MLEQQRDYVLHTVEERGVRLIRLWFTDVLGSLKSFAISPAELENALEDGMTFDGSSIDGYSRIQESDVLAFPDPNTFEVLPWSDQRSTEAEREPREPVSDRSAHSAVSPEPLVMGLIPAPARPTWAVTSVTDSSEGTPAVPDQREWDLLASVSGYQTVDIQRVSEPYPWVAAVAAGRISDPGVTAREIVAVVTRDTLENGQPRTVRSSVVLGVNLEGPPTRDAWAFVTLVTYTSIVMPS